MTRGCAQSTHAPPPEKPATRRLTSRGGSTFTLTVGDGVPIVLGHVRDRRDWERLLASLRHVFDNEEAHAEGWSTSAVPGGFLALNGGRAVTFRRERG